eukprot:543781-Rhodomonas_salina.2
MSAPLHDTGETSRVVADRPESVTRRAFIACHHCNLGKRQCENARPCGQCTFRGLQCKEAEKEITCALCKGRKLRCDKARPCRCARSFSCWIDLDGEADDNILLQVGDVPDLASNATPGSA